MWLVLISDLKKQGRGKQVEKGLARQGWRASKAQKGLEENL